MKKAILTIISVWVFAGVLSAQRPNLIWAETLPGDDYIFPQSVKVDNQGYIISAGTFSGEADFDSTSDSFMLTSSGYDDVFLQKLTANGGLEWAFHLGDKYQDRCNEIALDGAGNIYMTGIFSLNPDFDPGVGMHSLSSQGSGDIFIAKYSKQGELIWVHTFGGEYDDEGISITVDEEDNVLATGWFQGTVDFNPGAAKAELTSVGPDAYVLKLSSSGAFIWVQHISGNGWQEGHTIRTDVQNNVYISGLLTVSAIFNAGSGSVMLQTNNNDAFLAKYSPQGNLKWAIKPGGGINNTNIGKKRPLAFDPLGNVVLAYHFSQTVDFDPGVGIATLSTNGPIDEDIFIQKLDTNGNFIWVKQLGKNVYTDELGDLITDHQGNILLTGFFSGTVDFDLGTGVLEISCEDDYTQAIFAAKYTPEGELFWVHPILPEIGNYSWGSGHALAADPSGDVLVTGNFSGSFNWNPLGTPHFMSSTPDKTSGFSIKLTGTVSGLTTNPEEMAGMAVFPNPTTDFVTLQPEVPDQVIHVKVRNSLGELVGEYHSMHTSRIIDVSQLPSGIYFLEIQLEHQRAILPLIKQ